MLVSIRYGRIEFAAGAPGTRNSYSTEYRVYSSIETPSNSRVHGHHEEAGTIE